MKTTLALLMVFTLASCDGTEPTSWAGPSPLQWLILLVVAYALLMWRTSYWWGYYEGKEEVRAERMRLYDADWQQSGPRYECSAVLAERVASPEVMDTEALAQLMHNAYHHDFGRHQVGPFWDYKKDHPDYIGECNAWRAAAQAVARSLNA